MAIHRLTVTKCRNFSSPGRYTDGLGLHLLVKPSGAKSWVQRLVVRGGRRRDIGLGSFHLVTLAEARGVALENAKLARAGVDPIERRRQQRQPPIPTFSEAMAAVIELRGGDWSQSHKRQWKAMMENHAIPDLGGLRLDKIESGDVLRILAPLRDVSPRMAREVAARIETVMGWGVGLKYRADNPATAATALLPKKKKEVEHFDALHYREVPAAIDAIRAAESRALASRLAVEFVILTAARAAEVRGARWREVDMDAGTWTIPKERMKGRREHIVALSDAAIAVLRRAEAIRKSDIVFPGRSGAAIAEKAAGRVLETAGIKATPHGFRTSFRTWAAERSNAPGAVAEMALAHQVGNTVERSYQRSSLLDRRRDLMNAWAAFCTARPG